MHRAGDAELMPKSPTDGWTLLIIGCCLFLAWAAVRRR